MSDLFFVGIKDPASVRRDVLSSSKTMIRSLIKLEDYRQIRTRKLEHVRELKSVISSIVDLNHALRAHLPETADMPDEIPARTVRMPSAKSKPVRTTRLDRLREELDEFEKKLSELDA